MSRVANSPSSIARKPAGCTLERLRSDLSVSSPHVQRILMWDDLFLHRSVHKTVDQIRRAIPTYYGFDCRAKPNGSPFHLAGMNNFDEARAAVFDAEARARIALVDLESSGVTDLNWLQIVPRFRLHYDVAGGFACGLDESFDWLLQIAESRSFFCPRSIIALQMCDFGYCLARTVPPGICR